MLNYLDLFVFFCTYNQKRNQLQKEVEGNTIILVANAAVAKKIPPKTKKPSRSQLPQKIVQTQPPKPSRMTVTLKKKKDNHNSNV